ncbi:MAG: AraC family transcriptional regulator [Clostridiales bacterium]|nr:AraC family transcriptional regulator [Clostridiales bacterium]
MNNRESIFQSLDIIEGNLKSRLTVFDISKELGFSLYYFSRLFKGITGINPKAYMLNRKITQSVEDILNSNTKMIDIALDYGFGSSESFSRAFHKIIDLNPSDIKKNNSVDASKLFPKITREKIEHKNIIKHQEPELVELEPIYLVGLPFYYDMNQLNDLSDPWSQLTKNISGIENKMSPEKYYQLQYWFPNQDSDSIFFYIALEVTSYNNVPVQFTSKTIPKHHYLKFSHKGYSSHVGQTYQFIYEKWLPETSYKLPYFFNFEFYGDEHLGPYNEESVSEIYIPVKL